MKSCIGDITIFNSEEKIDYHKLGKIGNDAYFSVGSNAK